MAFLGPNSLTCKADGKWANGNCIHKHLSIFICISDLSLLNVEILRPHN